MAGRSSPRLHEVESLLEEFPNEALSAEVKATKTRWEAVKWRVKHFSSLNIAGEKKVLPVLVQNFHGHFAAAWDSFFQGFLFEWTRSRSLEDIKREQTPRMAEWINDLTAVAEEQLHTLQEILAKRLKGIQAPVPDENFIPCKDINELLMKIESLTDPDPLKIIGP